MIYILKLSDLNKKINKYKIVEVQQKKHGLNLPCFFLCYYFKASYALTAKETVAPTIGLFPIPI